MAHLAAIATDVISASGDLPEADPLIRRPSRTVENGAMTGWNRTSRGACGDEPRRSSWPATRPAAAGSGPEPTFAQIPLVLEPIRLHDIQNPGMREHCDEWLGEDSKLGTSER